jgi:hypothetical protein
MNSINDNPPQTIISPTKAPETCSTMQSSFDQVKEGILDKSMNAALENRQQKLLLLERLKEERLEQRKGNGKVKEFQRIIFHSVQHTDNSEENISLNYEKVVYETVSDLDSRSLDSINEYANEERHAAVKNTLIEGDVEKKLRNELTNSDTKLELQNTAMPSTAVAEDKVIRSSESHNKEPKGNSKEKEDSRINSKEQSELIENEDKKENILKAGGKTLEEWEEIAPYDREDVILAMKELKDDCTEETLQEYCGGKREERWNRALIYPGSEFDY